MMFSLDDLLLHSKQAVLTERYRYNINIMRFTLEEKYFSKAIRKNRGNKGCWNIPRGFSKCQTSLGSDVICHGVANTKFSPWSMWHQLNCFTDVSVCHPRSVGNRMFRTCSNGVTAAHLSPTLNYDAIQQRFLFLEPHSATILSAHYCIGF